MNRLLGTIVSVESSGEISLAEIRIGSENSLSVLVINAPELSPSLLAGKKVEVLFKESEVILIKGDAGNISVANRISARVLRIEEHALLSEIGLAYDEGGLRVLIPSKSSREMNLKAGDAVMALVNPMEITLAEVS